METTTLKTRVVLIDTNLFDTEHDYVEIYPIENGHVTDEHIDFWFQQYNWKEMDKQNISANGNGRIMYREFYCEVHEHWYHAQEFCKYCHPHI